MIRTPVFPTPTRRSVLVSGAALIGLAAGTGLSLTGGMARAATTAAATDGDAWLDGILHDATDHFIRRSPEWQTLLGLPDAAHDRWNEHTEEEEAIRQQLEQDGLARMRREVDPASLSAVGALNYRLWEYRAEESLTSYRWRHHDYDLEHFNGRHSGMPTLLINAQPVRSIDQFGHWEARVQSIGTAVDQLIAAAERRAALGIIPPRFSLEKSRNAVLGTMAGAPFGDAGGDSALFADIKREIAALKLPGAEEASLVARAQSALTDHYAPAYRRLADYIQALSARTDDRDGVWKLPDGAEYYRFCLKRHTTLDLDPEEVHALGLREVARIHQEMKAIRDAVGFKGGLQDFFQHLRTDSRFYYPDTPEGHAAYLADARRVVAEVEAVLDSQFGIKPRAPVIVQRFEPFQEAAEAIARYNPPAADGSRPGSISSISPTCGRCRASSWRCWPSTRRSPATTCRSPSPRRWAACPCSAATPGTRPMWRAGACTASGCRRNWDSIRTPIRISAD